MNNQDLRTGEEAEAFSKDRALLLCLFGIIVLLLTASICSAQSNDWRLEAQLIRVSDREPAIMPNAKVVEPVIAARLGKMPFRWDNFYEVARKPVSLPRSGVKSIPLNRLYHLQIRDLGKSQLEVGFYRKEKLLNKVRHPFSTGEMLILGGDNQDKETWLVILRGIDPRKI